MQRKYIKSQTNSRLVLKRKLVKELGEINQRDYHVILIRDPKDDEYPFIHSIADFINHPKWRYWQFYGHQPPDHITVIGLRQYAYVNWKTKEWDLLDDFDAGIPFHPKIFGLDQQWFDPKGKGNTYQVFFNHNVQEGCRGWLTELWSIHYDRIIAVDELGDSYNEPLHILVDYNRGGNPFDSKVYRFLESSNIYSSNHMKPEHGRRIHYFPKDIPNESNA